MDKNNVNESSGLIGLESESKAEFLKVIWNGNTYPMCLAKLVLDEHGAPVDYIILDINPAYEKAFGFSRDQVINKRATELFPHYASRWMEKCGEAVRLGKNPLTVESIFEHSQWYEVQVFPLGSGDQFIAMAQNASEYTKENTGTENDPTSNKIADEALIERVELLNVLMDYNPSLIFLKDECGRYVYLNRTYEQQFVGSKNWYGKTDFDLWPRESAELFRANDLAVLEAGRVIQYLEDSKDLDGTRYCWLNYKFPYTDSKNRRYSGGIGIDVTKRILAEEALRKAEDEIKRYAEELKIREEEALELIDGFTEGSWIVDREAGTIKCSEKWSRRIGLDRVPEKERLSYTHTLVHTEDTADGNSIEHCMETGLARFDLEYRVKTVDSGYIWTQNKGKIVYDTTGTAIKVYAASIDITERKGAEAALRESESRAHELVRVLEEANENKNRFISVLSHELRNPLAAITVGLSVLEVSADTQHTENVKEIIKRQVNQLCKLVDDLLDLTRITQNKIKLKKESILLNEIVRDAVEDIKPEFDKKGVQIWDRIQTQPIFLCADPIRIAQCVGNLLNNAVKFTPANGNVWVSLKQENNEAILSVQDNGIGISPMILAKLFQPFTQADESLDRYDNNGLGLGLSIVKGIIELHDGSVTAASEGLGKGALFTVRLPITQDNTQIQSNTAIKKSQRVAGFYFLSGTPESTR